MLGEPRLMRTLLDIMKKCWNEEQTPEEWRTYYMVAIPKKGDLTWLKNWRGLSMADTFAKLYAGVLQGRLEDIYETIAPEFCNGFRRGRSRTDSIFTLKEFLRQRKAKGLDTWVVLWDIVKMFDRIKREFLWRSMEVVGIDAKLIRVVQATMEATRGQLNVDGMTREVNIQDGTCQGSKMGPILCNLFLLPILEQWIADTEHLDPVLEAEGTTWQTP
jgi:sorting nexin-29